MNSKFSKFFNQWNFCGDFPYSIQLQKCSIYLMYFLFFQNFISDECRCRCTNVAEKEDCERQSGNRNWDPLLCRSLWSRIDNPIRKFSYIPLSREFWNVWFRSKCRLFQIAYVADFRSLCTVTFWQKVDLLISNATIQYILSWYQN